MPSLRGPGRPRAQSLSSIPLIQDLFWLHLKAGYPDQTLAQAGGITPSSLLTLRKGRTKASLKTLSQLAAFFGYEPRLVPTNGAPSMANLSKRNKPSSELSPGDEYVLFRAEPILTEHSTIALPGTLVSVWLDTSRPGQLFTILEYRATKSGWTYLLSYKGYAKFPGSNEPVPLSEVMTQEQIAQELAGVSSHD